MGEGDAEGDTPDIRSHFNNVISTRRIGVTFEHPGGNGVEKKCDTVDANKFVGTFSLIPEFGKPQDFHEGLKVRFESGINSAG